jgi:hypothetical protein
MKLINITILPNGKIKCNKTGVIITPVSLEESYINSKLKVKEYR